MDLLERVLGRPEKRTEYEDFINRYEQGSPYTSIDDREAVDRYHEVTPQLTRDEYKASAEAAFSRLSPAERAEFSQWLRTRANAQGVKVPDYDLNDDGIDDRMQRNPGELAEMTTRVHDKEPNILEQLLGKGGTGGMFDNPIAKIATAGIAAMAAQRLLGGRR
ncbi:MAG TPA: hypothetical protein VFO73_13845 [Candidatus Limnocylindrales bacterium]|nr:hypothetical protein [Candidatus Limnocylindrales bacterium]